MIRSWIRWFAASSLAALLAAPASFAAEAAELPGFDNGFVSYAVRADGTHARFTDKRDGKNYAKAGTPLGRVKKAGQEHAASAVERNGDRLIVRFGDSGVNATLRVGVKPQYLLFEVESVSDPAIESLAFFDLPLTLTGGLDEPFAGCALARNLKTDVPEMPGPNARLRATCYTRFGLNGAGVAIIGCPQADLRKALQAAVTDAPDLPHSSLGGPWALDAAINQGSYLFNFGGLSEKNVDQWIDVARRTGMNQIDFHGGSSFRFGDIRFNPETYPNGAASMKAVIDRLHAAGIAAGLHTYAFFIDKQSKWVSPVPDPRLAKAATLTLAEAITADAAQLSVAETTEKMSTLTGFFVWNSVTLQVDDELIVFGGVNKNAPYGFTSCRRGAWGTKAAAHAKGAKVHHLKECFGLFLPDGDSSLLSEVAARTAEAFNECGFDMIYLDALDGEGILGGPEAGWHYGSKFVYEIYKHVKRPPLMEMSTFHHHLWCVRSRNGAWDFPNRAHKKFIDMHCDTNAASRRMFLPAHLGWWSVKMWGGLQDEPTYADDIEYLCCKCIGNDVGFSLQGVNPDTIGKVPAYGRLSEIMRRYEELRHRNVVPEAIKAKLRRPGDEYTLVQTPAGAWSFLPVQYERHKVEGLDGRTNTWTTRNRFAAQPVRLRIEALLSAVAYDAPGASAMTDFANTTDWADRAADAGIKADLATSSDVVKAGGHSGRITAANARPAGAAAVKAPVSAWARFGRTFSAPINLKNREGMGLWVHGDGLGEVLNLQLRSPEHLISGYGEHYIPIDFTGWRYFELLELDNNQSDNYAWPYGGSAYALYREMVHYDQISTLNLWINNVPPGKTATCYVSPIKSLPLLTSPVVNPSVSIGGRTITFPVSIETGNFLEFGSMTDCKLYARDGRLISEVKPAGDVPALAAGDSKVEFRCEPPKEGNARAYVTVISQGDALR